VEAEPCDECLRQLKSLQEKSEETQQIIAQMQAAGEAALEDLKAGVQTAWDVMEAALRSARGRMK